VLGQALVAGLEALDLSECLDERFLYHIFRVFPSSRDPEGQLLDGAAEPIEEQAEAVIVSGHRQLDGCRVVRLHLAFRRRRRHVVRCGRRSPAVVCSPPEA